MSKMKKAPFKVLVCIVDKEKADLAWKILENARESFNISSMVDSIDKFNKLSMVGISTTPRIMITGLVRTDNASRVLQGLDLVLCPDDDKTFGIAFTINLSSMSREMLNYFVNKQKEKTSCF